MVERVNDIKKLKDFVYRTIRCMNLDLSMKRSKTITRVQSWFMIKGGHLEECNSQSVTFGISPLHGGLNQDRILDVGPSLGFYDFSSFVTTHQNVGLLYSVLVGSSKFLFLFSEKFHLDGRVRSSSAPEV